MQMLVTDNLLVFSLLPLGYGSGGGFGKYSGAYSPAIGIIYGILFSAPAWWLPLFALAGWISEKPSPARDALGNITDHHADAEDYVYLAIRGLIGAVPYLALYFVGIDTWIMLTFVAAWPLSVYIGTKLPKLNAWQWSEILRYFTVGIVIQSI